LPRLKYVDLAEKAHKPTTQPTQPTVGYELNGNGISHNKKGEGMNLKMTLISLGLVFVSGLSSHANSSRVDLEPILDGSAGRCVEGGDTLGNNIIYTFGGATAKFNAQSGIVSMALNVVYHRCKLINGSATLVSGIDPFAPYTYKVPYINENGERALNVMTVRLDGLQMVASKSESFNTLAKSAVVTSRSLKGQNNSLNFNLKLKIHEALSTSELADLNSGKDASINIILTSTGKDREATDFSPGGSFLMSFTLSKARNSQENISNIKIQHLN
jgi:hypothetical protein